MSDDLKNDECEIEKGGEWLAAARNWIQWNVNGGDRLTWTSTESVSLPFNKLEEFARCVAKIAYKQGSNKKSIDITKILV